MNWNRERVGMNSRRKFIGASAAGALSTICRPLAVRAASVSKAVNPIVVFAKPLQGLSAMALGKRLKSIGVDGIEATLRKGGQIEPRDFESKLPRFRDDLAQFGQRIVIAASNINTVSAENERQLRVLADNGIEYIRAEYYRYDFGKPILPQLDAFAAKAEELASLCKSLGIAALYQNHAGKNYVGSALWDLQRVLSEVDANHFGLALDIRHTAVELSNSWRSAYMAIRPKMRALYVKDFAWVDGKATNVALGKGVAHPLFEQVRAEGIVGPISLHMEYVDHRVDELLERRWARVVSDAETLQNWMK